MYGFVPLGQSGGRGTHLFCLVLKIKGDLQVGEAAKAPDDTMLAARIRPSVNAIRDMTVLPNRAPQKQRTEKPNLNRLGVLGIAVTTGTEKSWSGKRPRHRLLLRSLTSTVAGDRKGGLDLGGSAMFRMKFAVVLLAAGCVASSGALAGAACPTGLEVSPKTGKCVPPPPMTCPQGQYMHTYQSGGGIAVGETFGHFCNKCKPGFVINKSSLSCVPEPPPAH